MALWDVADIGAWAFRQRKRLTYRYLLVNLSWMDGCLDSATRSRDRQRTARAPSREGAWVDETRRCSV